MNHLLTLNRTWACDEHNLRPSDGHLANLNDGVLRMEIPAGQLERRADPEYLVDTGQKLELTRIDPPYVADQPQNRPVDTIGAVHRQLQRFDLGLSGPDLFLGGVGLKNDDHHPPQE